MTATFNSSLREGVLPGDWKCANVIPLPKITPMNSVEKDICPISLTPIWVDEIVSSKIDDRQFCGISGTSTTDALVAMTHKWYEATDELNTYVRMAMLDFS